MSGSKFRFIFINYKSKNREDLSFQFEEKLLLKINFSLDGFPKLPPTKHVISFHFHFLTFFAIVINGGRCNL